MSLREKIIMALTQAPNHCLHIDDIVEAVQEKTSVIKEMLKTLQEEVQVTKRRGGRWALRG